MVNDLKVFTGQSNPELAIGICQSLGLDPGLIEFVRSSRIAIIKSSEGVHKKVLDMQKNDPRKSPINNEYLNHKSKIFQM